jgi:pimeloyl-ACP methyl ester carboxylesterase
MPYVTVGRENTGDIGIYYEDHGTGAPVVLVHGYLADGRSWEKQETAPIWTTLANAWIHEQASPLGQTAGRKGCM